MSSSASVVATGGPLDSTPRGPAIDVLLNLVAVTSIFLVTSPRGPKPRSSVSVGRQSGNPATQNIMFRTFRVVMCDVTLVQESWS
jgi:hypothetical protein